MGQPKNKKDWRKELEQVTEQLRDPFRMRIAVALVMIAIMFFAISEPLHGRMKQKRRDLNQLRETVKTAEEVLLLRDSMASIESRIVQGEGNDAITSFFIELFRSAPVDLLQIDAESAQRLGPIYSARVRIDLAGSFAELNETLHLVESQYELLRVETISFTPADRGQTRPTMQLSVRVLKEKA